MAQTVEIRHEQEHARWAAVDGEQPVGTLTYELADGVLDLRHTVVDPAHRGRGLAGRLVEAAMAYARERQLLVRPSCPFVPRYLADHPEHHDLVVAGDGA